MRASVLLACPRAQPEITVLNILEGRLKVVLYFSRALACISVLALCCGVAAQSQRNSDSEGSGSNQRGIFGQGQPGEVSVVRMEAKRLGMKNFKMQSRSSNGRLAIDAFTSTLGSGTFKGVGLVDWSRPNDRQQMTIQFQNVEAAALLKAFEIKVNAQVIAMVSGTIQVQWNGTRGSLPRETMTGSVSIQFGPGTVTNADVLNMTASATGIAELQRFDFSSAQLEGTISNGLVTFTKALFAGQTQQAVGSGNLDLRTEEVRVKWDVYLSPDLALRSTRPEIRAAGGLVNKARGSSGLTKIPLPIAMVGSVRNPDFVFANTGADKTAAASTTGSGKRGKQ
ncbi:MAG: AsmA-like C-terminal region-containing protein [Candidatus Sumerlaeaceae bacterium]